MRLGRYCLLLLASQLPALTRVLACSKIRKIVVNVKIGPTDDFGAHDFDMGQLIGRRAFKPLQLFARNG